MLVSNSKHCPMKKVVQFYVIKRVNPLTAICRSFRLSHKPNQDKSVPQTSRLEIENMYRYISMRSSQRPFVFLVFSCPLLITSDNAPPSVSTSVAIWVHQRPILRYMEYLHSYYRFRPLKVGLKIYTWYSEVLFYCSIQIEMKAGTGGGGKGRHA